MKRSGNEQSTDVPHKVFELSREALEALDKEALIERLISMEDQLQEARDKAQRAKRRETLAHLQVIQRDRELGDLKNERHNAYYGNGNQRDQLLDPYFYEAFIAMKEKLANKNKTLTEQVETITALKCSEDAKALYKYVTPCVGYRARTKGYDRIAHSKTWLNKRIKLANTAFHAILRDKKDLTEEITKKDAKIAKLYKEIYQLRSELSEDVIFEQMDEEEDVKPLVTTSSSVESLNTAVQSSTVGEDDVIILEDDSVSTSRAPSEPSKDDDNTVGVERSGSEERCVSVDESGKLKITV